MAQESTIPQKLMTAALLHFEQGVPIDDCDIRTEQRERLARVSHVYWQYVKNPFLEPFGLFKQLAKQKGYADIHCEWKAACMDKTLFDFVLEHVSVGCRHEDELMVRTAAKQAIRIGLETDNPTALVKGGKLLSEVARLNEPEEDKGDMNKLSFLPPVVTTSAKEIDETKDDMNDDEMKRIMQKYNGYVDEKDRNIDRMVEVMAAKSQGRKEENAEYDEQDR